MQTIPRRSMLKRAAEMACLVVVAGCVLGRGQEPAQLNRSLKILYAGHTGSDREKDFVAFLRKHFDVVQTGNLQTFKEADTQGFDVTLLDWDWNELKGPRPALSPSFSRPVLTLGVPGGMMCRQWGLKTRYM